MATDDSKGASHGPWTVRDVQDTGGAYLLVTGFRNGERHAVARVWERDEEDGKLEPTARDLADALLLSEARDLAQKVVAFVEAQSGAQATRAAAELEKWVNWWNQTKAGQETDL